MKGLIKGLLVSVVLFNVPCVYAASVPSAFPGQQPTSVGPAQKDKSAKDMLQTVNTRAQNKITPVPL